MSGLHYDANKPAQNHMEAKRKFENVTLCGVNRGPHDLIPIEKFTEITKDTTIEFVTVLMCRTCFVRMDVKMLVANFPKVSL